MRRSVLCKDHMLLWLHSQSATFQGMQESSLCTLLPLLLCWCKVFHTMPPIVWIDLNDQLVVADLTMRHEHLLLATATAPA